MPEVSIIIPVYNSHSYVIDCLESIAAQTVADYEVIIVNDGSTDNCEQLITDYISQNNLSDFHLFSKPNGGISSARNLGLSKAQGKWVMFVDSDDWLEPDCLRELLSVADRSCADLVIGGYQAYDQISGHKDIWSHYPCDGGSIPEDINSLHSFSFIWGRLYQKEIIDHNGLRFDERIKYAEDNAWQLDYLCYAKSFAYSHSILYNYRINNGEQITGKLINPMMKRYRWEHLQGFLSTYPHTDIDDVLKKNPRFLSVVWGILTDAAIIDILDKKKKQAKAKVRSSFSKSVVAAFSPRSKKEKIFLFFWKHSFLMLRVFVLVYYKNFENLRSSKLMNLISKRK